MQLKLPPLEIPSDDPFRYDALERRNSVEAIASFLDNLDGPFVLAVNSPWGTGKTTFVNMLKSFLESRGFLCLYFNAWQTDFSTDPLIAFLGEMSQLMKSHKGWGKALDRTKHVGTLIAKRMLPVAAKLATGGLLDLNDFAEKALADFASGAVNDAVDAYTAERDLIVTFHRSLEETIRGMRDGNKKENLIIFVDEVDRCRPTFAVDLLERIKHLFNVQNIIFVISLDKAQLAVSLASVYGNGIDSDEYLRRFLDMEYLLPKANPTAFAKHLFERSKADSLFEQRKSAEFRYDRDQIKRVFSGLSDLFQLSLRAREQSFTTIRIAVMMTPDNYHIYPGLLTILAILKVATPDLYRRYALEGGSAGDLMNELQATEAGKKFFKSNEGVDIEVELITAKCVRFGSESPELQLYRRMASDGSVDKEEKERADHIVRVIDYMGQRRQFPPLNYVVNKIELAAQFKE